MSEKNMHQENIKKVQTETVKIITETERIIDSLVDNESTKSDKNDKKTLSLGNLTQHKKMLINEKQKLDNLEYVVAVVGTMKAGKSMTINAIVGQEVLPSREFPMTTLPTLITHKQGQEKPILNLKNIEPFQKLLQEIKEKIETSKTSEQRDLNSLIDKIKNSEISFKKSYEGQEQIESFLKQINDLMRIAKDFDIEPPYNDFTDVNDLPRIEVEFYHLSKEENSSNAKLTLLDTPGPDEFKHSTLLKEIFKNQLQRASAVMLLVDYTKMNSQSDVEVKEQVKEVADMIGKQHLFVLLNKFDQRKRSDDVEEKKEEAKRLIAEDVLKGQIDKNNIYPISAKSAFYANFGLRELAKNGKIDTSVPWIEDFGVTLMGEDWEDDIDDIKRVQKKCEKTWEKSFFEEPLENIISTIHSDALFLSLKSPLDKLDNLLREYGNAFKVRQEAYTTKLPELKNMIKELKEDIQNTENIKSSISTKSSSFQKELKEKIHTTLNNKFKEFKEKIYSILTEKTTSNQDSRYEEIERKIKEKHDKVWNLFGHDIRPKNLEDKTKEEKNRGEELFSKLKEDGEIEFLEKEDFSEFVREITKNLNVYLNEFHSTAIENIDKGINSEIKGINEYINEKLFATLDNIKSKIGDDIIIKLPSLEMNGLNNVFITDVDSLYNVESYNHTEKKSQDGVIGKIKRELDIFGLGLGYDEISVKKDKYKFNKKNIVDELGKALKEVQKNIESDLEKKFKINIGNPIHHKMEYFIKEIEGYRAEQINILKDKETKDKRFLEEDFERDIKYDKKIKKIGKRVEISIGILGTKQ